MERLLERLEAGRNIITELLFGVFFVFSPLLIITGITTIVDQFRWTLWWGGPGLGPDMARTILKVAFMLLAGIAGLVIGIKERGLPSHLMCAGLTFLAVWFSLNDIYVMRTFEDPLPWHDGDLVELISVSIFATVFGLAILRNGIKQSRRS